MNTENESKSAGRPIPRLNTPTGIEPELPDSYPGDELRAFELALEAELPHLKIIQAYDSCFSAGEVSRQKDSDAANLPTATLFLDLSGSIVMATQRACQLLGRSIAELKNHPITAFWRNRDRIRMGSDYLKHLKAFYSSGRIHYVNMETADGGQLPVKMRTERLPIGGFSPIGQVAVTIESISAKEIINRAIDQDFASLKEFSETFPFPVFLKDAEHRFILVNDEFCRELSGCKQQDVLGKCDAAFFPAKQVEKYILDDNYVLQYGQTLETTELHTPPEGDPIQVHVFKLPYFREGRVIGIICMYWPVEKRDTALGLLSFKG